MLLTTNHVPGSSPWHSSVASVRTPNQSTTRHYKPHSSRSSQEQREQEIDTRATLDFENLPLNFQSRKKVLFSWSVWLTVPLPWTNLLQIFDNTRITPRNL